MFILRKHQKQQKKENKDTSDHKFFDRLKNLTDSIFTEDETKLIEKDFKQNLPEKCMTKVFETLEVDVEIAINNNSNNIKQTYAASKIIKTEFMKYGLNTHEHNIANSVKIKIKRDYIIFA